MAAPKKQAVAEEVEPTSHTVSALGIEVTIDANVFDDVDLLDMLDDFQNGEPFKFKKILVRIFGDQADSVFAQLRNENGKVTASHASEFFTAVMDEVNAKN